MGSCYSRKIKNPEKQQARNEKERPSQRSKWQSFRKRRSRGEGSDPVHVSSKETVKLWKNGTNRSGTACLHTKQGRKGVNQDAMVVCETVSSEGDTTFCGVFDGHGPFGHMVSKKVRDSLPIILHNEGLNDQVPDSFKEWISSAFKQMDEELKSHPTIDCFCSGTTAVALIKKEAHLVIGNIGDSRAVLATRDDKNALVATQLTVDLKPSLPNEAARIQQNKGRVFALPDEPEVARVWMPNSDAPGLAMTRAFGDFCLKDYGLISVPEIYHHEINPSDEFVVLATDGIWDVLTNDEVVQIVSSVANRQMAAKALVESAVRSWKLKFPASKNDDCAAVCMFFKESTAPGGYVVDNAEEVNEVWSALQGVTRVNTLLSLPRYISRNRKGWNS